MTGHRSRKPANAWLVTFQNVTGYLLTASVVSAHGTPQSGSPSMPAITPMPNISRGSLPTHAEQAMADPWTAVRRA